MIDALRAAYGPARGQASVGERINERLTQWQVAAGLEAVAASAHARGPRSYYVLAASDF